MKKKSSPINNSSAENARFLLGKEQTLRSKKIIAELFESGERIKSFPFIAICKEVEFPDSSSIKWVFSAPKKKFRKATERNRIKRICREAIRLNKKELELNLSKQNKQLAVFLVYTSANEISHEELQKKTRKLMNTLINHFDETVS